jgi:ABC-2 type transport system permease protein
MMTGMWALYAREVKRFQKIMLDTVFSPLVNVALYLGVFGVVAGDRMVDGISYLAFVYIGLLSMMLINSSFSNPSFALIIAKNVGSIIDLQLVPIRNWKIGIAYALAGLTRGFITLGIAVLATVWFIPLHTIEHPVLLLAGVAITGIEFGMLGVAFGFWAKSFESLTILTTFIMQPMIFLAGVFYPIATLPAPWNIVSQFNPIHHNVNIIRYAATGYSDGSVMVSAIVVCAISALFFALMNFVTRQNLRMQ